MNGRRLNRMVRGLVVLATILALATASPVDAAGGTTSVLVAAPVGATSSTVYLSVTNVGLEPTCANINLTLTSGSTTLVGFTSVSVGPLSTTVVPVRMSGTLSLAMKLNLSSLLTVGVVDTAEPF